MRKFPCGRSVNLGKVSHRFTHFRIITQYPRNGQSVDLQAMENCICSLRCIERNIRSILQTMQEKSPIHKLFPLDLECDPCHSSDLPAKEDVLVYIHGPTLWQTKLCTVQTFPL